MEKIVLPSTIGEVARKQRRTEQKSEGEGKRRRKSIKNK